MMWDFFGIAEGFVTPFDLPALGVPGEGFPAATGAVAGLVLLALGIREVEGEGLEAGGLLEAVLVFPGEGILLVPLPIAGREVEEVVVCGRVGVVLERDDALLLAERDDLGLIGLSPLVDLLSLSDTGAV